MRIAKVFLTSLFVMAIVFLTAACQHEKIIEDTFYPPEKASWGEEVQIDSMSSLAFLEARVETVGDEKHLILLYDWENLSEKAKVTMDAYSLSLSQDGVALKPSLAAVADKNKLVSQVSAKGTLSGIEQGFILIDESDITLQIKGKDKFIIKDTKPLNAYPVKVDIAWADIKK